VVEKDGQVVAIAVWFLNYSTWTGRQLTELPYPS
jgi:hypothetical protein